MPKAKKVSDAEFRVLDPSEYPASITAPRGAYTPIVEFAATTPLGLYHVEDQGAGSGHLMAYFTPKRRGSRPKMIGGANSLAGALTRISNHEDEALHPDAPRERGQSGPVNVFSLGRRTQGPKPDSQLDREIRQHLAERGIVWGR